ncbi:hypothetical protein E0Z10_g6554 [Xylaria hypoxylon]|uniref:Uncharacterized protein n=1 Tax=Xylaria hypoxylon TaxID=37992 RepID=A0A4Z0YT07_9PEZI|nr:hypothetical protein E0Z10_g6554 [Xylaria hypoxylon]
MQNTLVDTVITTIASTAFAIFGVAIAVHKRWLQDHNGLWMCFLGTQILLALVLVITGGYLADHVNGFQSSFNNFGGGENIPYYNVMYFGGVAEAAYGALVIVVVLLMYLTTTGGRETGYAATRREGAEGLR